MYLCIYVFMYLCIYVFMYVCVNQCIGSLSHERQGKTKYAYIHTIIVCKCINPCIHTHNHCL